MAERTESPSPGGGGSTPQASGWGDGAQPTSPVSRFRRATAQRLRAAPTEPEDRLWHALKAMPLTGSHFRRQVPIGPYVVDFACLAAKLVVEVDGSGHGHVARAERDAERTAWLEAEGYRVLRFWNAEVARALDGVLAAIHAAMPLMDGELEPLTHRRHNRRTAAVTPPRR